MEPPLQERRQSRRQTSDSALPPHVCERQREQAGPIAVARIGAQLHTSTATKPAAAALPSLSPRSTPMVGKMLPIPLALLTTAFCTLISLWTLLCTDVR